VTPLGWLLALGLVGAVAGLAIVPYFRAEARAAEGSPHSDVRFEIEAALRHGYCLACGGRVDPPTLAVCPHCGAERGSDR
jgi:Zn finger protein HypA/HybF involved in hydrogenase expression